MADARKLLEKVLSIIEADIAQLETRSKEGKLDHDDALDLQRYSKAILEVVCDLDAQSEKKSSVLANLADEELEAAAAKLLKERKKQRKERSGAGNGSGSDREE